MVGIDESKVFSPEPTLPCRSPNGNQMGNSIVTASSSSSGSSRTISTLGSGTTAYTPARSALKANNKYSSVQTGHSTVRAGTGDNRRQSIGFASPIQTSAFEGCTPSTSSSSASGKRKRDRVYHSQEQIDERIAALSEIKDVCGILVRKKNWKIDIVLSDSGNPIPYWFAHGFNSNNMGELGKNHFKSKEDVINFVADNRKLFKVVMNSSTTPDLSQEKGHHRRKEDDLSPGETLELVVLDCEYDSRVGEQPRNSRKASSSVPNLSPKSTQKVNLKGNARSAGASSTLAKGKRTAGKQGPQSKTQAPPPPPPSASSTQSSIDSPYMLSSKEAWKLLQALGFKYASGLYCFPDLAPKEKIEGKNTFSDIRNLIREIYLNDVLDTAKYKGKISAVEMKQLEDYVTLEGKAAVERHANDNARRSRRPPTIFGEEAAKNNAASDNVSKGQLDKHVHREGKKSTEKSTSETDAIMIRQREYLTRKITDETVFTREWTKLKAEGWTWTNGTGLTSFKYMPPGKSCVKGKGIEGVDYFASESAVLDSLTNRGRTAEEVEIESVQKACMNLEDGSAGPGRSSRGRRLSTNMEGATQAVKAVAPSAGVTSNKQKNGGSGKPSGKKRRRSSPLTPPDVKKTKPQSPGGCLSDSSSEECNLSSAEKEARDYDWQELWPRLKMVRSVFFCVYLRQRALLMRTFQKKTYNAPNLHALFFFLFFQAGWAEKKASREYGLEYNYVYVRPNRDHIGGKLNVDFFGSKEHVIKFVKEQDKTERRSSKSSKKPIIMSTIMNEFSQEAHAESDSEEELVNDNDQDGYGNDDSGFDDAGADESLDGHHACHESPMAAELLDGKLSAVDSGVSHSATSPPASCSSPVQPIDSPYMLSWSEAWKLLQKLGFKWAGGLYCFPSVGRKKLEGVDSFSDFKGLLHRMYRDEALEKSEFQDKISEDDMRQLEEYVAFEGNEFEKKNGGTEGGKRKRVRVGHNDAENAGETAQSSKRSRDGNKRPRSEAVATAADAAAPSTASGEMSSSDSDNGRQNSALATPLAERSISEVLNQAKRSLHPSTISSPESQRSEEHNFFLSFLKDAMRNWGASSSLYCCGGPGTGKTVTITNAIEAATEWAQSNAKEILGERSSRYNPMPSFSFVNVAHLNSSNAPQDKILETIASDLGVADNATEAQVQKRLEAGGNTTKRTAFLVLDEMDLLVKSRGRGGATERFLYTLFKWASDDSMSFVLICVSNSIDYSSTLDKLGTVGEGKHPEVKVFAPYKKDGIIDIIEKRAGLGVFSKPALELIGRKVAANSGDCRSALELAGKSIDQAVEALTEEHMGQLFAGHLENMVEPVQIQDVMKAVKSTQSTMGDKARMIEGLPFLQQVVLCVAIVLSKDVRPGRETLTLGKLMMYCKEASTFGVMDRIDPPEFMDILRSLDDNGLIEDIGGGDSSISKWSLSRSQRHKRISLKTTMDEVECALEETLAQKPFFQTMLLRMEDITPWMHK